MCSMNVARRGSPIAPSCTARAINACPVAQPIPLLAPVIRATLSFMSDIGAPKGSLVTPRRKPYYDSLSKSVFHRKATRP